MVSINEAISAIIVAFVLVSWSFIMFDYLVKKAERVSYAERNRISRIILKTVVGVETFAAISSSIISVLLSMVTNSDEVGIISFCFFVPMISVWTFIAMDTDHMGMEENEKELPVEDVSPRKTNDYDLIVSADGKMPHFGRMYRQSQISDIIASQTFHPFVDGNGKKIKSIKVSEDDKWVCILGGYYPIDLICGYNKEMNMLYAIDGTMISLPLRGKLPSVKADIEAFFESRGEYFKKMPIKARNKFETALDRPKEELSKADWSSVRYQWEKLNAGNRTEVIDGKERPLIFEPVTKSGHIDDDIFERVLTDAEIAKAVKAVRKNKVILQTYTTMENYQNEYAVCNGIRILKSLDRELRLPGMDFLFQCLNDVDEAYFPMAVDLLKAYPKTMVREKIEENARIAYQDYDVQELGGLLFLAKTIGYEIEYVKEIKENQMQAETAGTSALNAVPSFDIDEDALYGSENVQEFSPYAYQKPE